MFQAFEWGPPPQGSRLSCTALQLGLLGPPTSIFFIAVERRTLDVHCSNCRFDIRLPLPNNFFICTYKFNCRSGAMPAMENSLTARVARLNSAGLRSGGGGVSHALRRRSTSTAGKRPVAAIVAPEPLSGQGWLGPPGLGKRPASADPDLDTFALQPPTKQRTTHALLIVGPSPVRPSQTIKHIWRALKFRHCTGHFSPHRLHKFWANRSTPLPQPHSVGAWP